MFSLRDADLITMYMPGSHQVAEISFLRLTPLGREEVASWPESGETTLEPDQEQLLARMVEAVRAAPVMSSNGISAANTWGPM